MVGTVPVTPVLLPPPLGELASLALPSLAVFSSAFVLELLTKMEMEMKGLL